METLRAENVLLLARYQISRMKYKLLNTGTYSVIVATVMTMSACKPKNESAAPKVPAFDMSAIDTTVLPVDDFDQYANGNWKKNNEIPGTESRWGAFSILDKENLEVKIKGIIDELLKKSDYKKGSDEQLISDYYRAYIDTANIEKLGVTPLKQYVDKIDAIKSLDEYAALAGEFQRFGVSQPAGFYVYADAKDSKTNALYTFQSGLSLGERSYYDNNDESMQNIRKEFVAHVNKMFELAGFPEKNAGETILAFETGLAKLQLTNIERRDPIKTYNKIAFTDLAKLSPKYNITLFAEKQQMKNDSIIAEDLKYITNSGNYMASVPLETLKTYFKWNLLSANASSLNKAIVDEDFKFFSTTIRGVKEQRVRSEKALRTTNGTVGEPLGKIYAEKYFPKSSRKQVEEMIENVRTVYGERIDQLVWMSPETKIKAKEKLKSFTYKIGYPDKWKDLSKVDISATNLVQNNINMSIWQHEDNVSKIGKPVDKEEWGMTPQTVNAYYNPLFNEVVFPAGILQPPFFNADADDAINYGGIMAVIGHELTHGFDDQGSQYDSQGNLVNWWTDADRANFMALAGKYVTYFDNIEAMPGVKIKGGLTIGENIADLGGLTLAYYALEKSLKGKPEPALIDGLNWKQRFFLGWAQVWRMNTTDAALRNQIETDPHSPARFRINATLSHMKEFQDAWGSKGGNKMVLPDSARVVIW
jgi:putative endopeptidase